MSKPNITYIQVECNECDIYDPTEANCRECLKKGYEPDCPYIVNGKCIGKNACDLKDVCKFYKDGEQE